MKIDLENDLEKPGVGPFWESGDPVMFRNVYFIPGTRSISFREFRVIFNAKVHFLPGFTKYAYFIPRSGYSAFGTLYTPEKGAKMTTHSRKC